MNVPLEKKKQIKPRAFSGHSLRGTKARKMTTDIISALLVLLFAAITLLPIWWMFRSSLTSSYQELFGTPPKFFPEQWLWSNYDFNPDIFNFWKYLGNTLTIVLPCVVFGTLTAISCSYAFARLRFKGKKFLFSLCVGSMLLPTMVTLIPLFIVWSRVGLVDTFWPLILPYLCGGGAFNIFLLRQFMMTIPRELDEAAAIDGASRMRTLTSIIIPSIKPAITVVALLIFITTWNDLLSQTIYIFSKDKYTIVMGLTAFFGSFTVDYAKMFAAVCLSFLPCVIIYLIGQKSFVEGIVMTGMKN